MKNNKGFAPILVILVVLVLLGAVYYLGTLKNKPTIVSNIPTPTPTIVINPTTNPVVTWKTYITKDNKFTFKYPSDWNLVDDSKNIDLYGDGKFQFQQNITISKGEYKFTSYNPLAWGPGECTFPDSPKSNGPSANFDTYVEIKGLINTYRRAKADLSPDVMGNNQLWTICSKEITSNYFVSVAWFGAAKYETPLNYNESYLKIMDQILGSLQLVK